METEKTSAEYDLCDNRKTLRENSEFESNKVKETLKINLYKI